MPTNEMTLRLSIITLAALLCACSETQVRNIPVPDEETEVEPEDCANGLDDDADGFFDCEDEDCHEATACTAEDCDDQEDNDGDGFVDCEDEDCWENPICLQRSTVNVQGFPAPQYATQANAFLQVQCADPANCADATVIWRHVEITDEYGASFEEMQYLADDGYNLLADLWWSLEVAPIGCDDRIDNCAEFLPPSSAQAFTIEEDIGLRFDVAGGEYSSPISCDIQEACDFRSVQAGAVYRWDTLVCQPSEGTPLNVRVGFDWLACRGLNCPDGNDDWLSANQSAWFPLQPGTCVHLI